MLSPVPSAQQRDRGPPDSNGAYAIRVNHVYLGPSAPRWEPRAEDDLRTAIEGGLFEETHWVELKRELSTGKAANQELARDLASFAVHGGTLIIGVAEGDDGLDLAPQPLEGVPERIEQVARSIPDPPLHVFSHTISSRESLKEGYLVVSIPPSADAPHMVGSRYMGRGDKTKRNLTDPEVRELHAHRLSHEKDMHALLDWQVGRDPLGTHVRSGALASNEDDMRPAHLFLVAQPQPSRPGMLRGVVSDHGWQQRLLNLRQSAIDPALLKETGLRPLPPSLAEAGIQQRRSDGAALTSYGIERDRTVIDENRRKHDIEWEVSEDGQMRLFCSRLSDALQDGTQFLLDELAALLVRQLIAVVVSASEQVGYLGPWGLGVAGVGMRGLYPAVSRQAMFGGGSPYTENDYRRVAAATYADLTYAPGAVADALVGQLLRGLGTDQRFMRAITDS